MAGRAALFDRVERDLDRTIFRSRVNDQPLPESVQRQVARSTAAVRFEQHLGKASIEVPEITGLIQMGGYCDFYYEGPTVDIARGRVNRHRAFFQCH